MILLMLAPMISGCFAGNTVEEIIESSPFDNLCPDGIANNTWYHYPGAVNALSAPHIINGTSILQGENVPMCTKGTYYGIGFSTFEPTIGITSADNLYMTSWGNGPGGSTAIIRCTDMIEMVDVSSYSCENTYQGAVANSNDPYVYVDRWTDRIMKFDMHALAGMTVEWSDDEGETWGPFGLASFATGYSVQDHQTIASSPYNAAFHETTWVFCVNGNWQSPLCSTSNDGGLTWGPEVPGAPINCNSGGLTGHMVGANDGNFYRGNPSCDGEGYSIYRSTNGGLTWTEHELPTDVTGMADTWNFEEAQVYPDELCFKIIKGLLRQMQRDGRIQADGIGITVSEEEYRNRGDINIMDYENQQAWDDNTGEQLDWDKVVQARQDEMVEVNNHKVYVKAPIK